MMKIAWNFNSEQHRMTRKRLLCDKGFNQADSESRGIKRQRKGIVEVTERLRRDIQHKLETVSPSSQNVQKIDQPVNKVTRGSKNPKGTSDQSLDGVVCETAEKVQHNIKSSENNQKDKGLKQSRPKSANSDTGKELPNRKRGLPKQFTLQNPINFASWIKNINAFMVRTQISNFLYETY